MKNQRKFKLSKDIKNISAVDLFCGIGGLTYGLIKAGIPVKAGIDSDETCRYAYEENNNTIFINKDLTKLSSKTVKEFFGDNDIKILVGCAPCQPFSTHTKKNKKNKKSKRDIRWKLLYSFRKLVKKLEPDIVSMENVPDLKNHRVFKDFLKCLKRHKYFINYKIIYCPEYGIPQNRRRLVLLASKDKKIEFIKRTHKENNFVTLRQTIGKLGKIKSGEISKKDPLHRSIKLSDINLERIKNSKPGGNWNDWDNRLLAKCQKKKTGKSYKSVYARMEWDKPASTITTQFYNYGTGRFGHPVQNRAISLREGALLQTFPRKYKFVKYKKEISFERIGKYIGNAVPVKLGQIIGKSILKHFENNSLIKGADD